MLRSDVPKATWPNYKEDRREVMWVRTKAPAASTTQC